MDSGYVVVDANSDVVVAGAGIIGLSIALELATAGLRVTVVERGTSMTEASWAAAGMLAARDPENPAKLRRLAEFSLSLYSHYITRIEQLSNRNVPIQTRVTLQATGLIGSPEKCLDPSCPDARYRHCALLSPALATTIAPHLALSGREFRLLEEESLDPRDLCAALPIAAKAAGVKIIENTSVLDVLQTGLRVEVTTNRGVIRAGDFVNCAGAWAGNILSRAPIYGGGHPSADDSPVHSAIKPRKGQMVAVYLEPKYALSCVIRTPEVYLVPRGDGRVVIGATIEDAGFDKLVDPVAIGALIGRAAALWPPIASAAIVETWAGLRPGTPNGLPVIGPSSHADLNADKPYRQWVASGHFRNGILLAPATARLISQLIRGVAPEIDVTAFRSPQTSSDNAACRAL